MNKESSVRNFVPSPTAGKDAKDSLGATLATSTPAQKASNETKQSTVANPPTSGANGGWNTNK
jgi:hypothetical protein